jgi:hypothetical protein
MRITSVKKKKEIRRKHFIARRSPRRRTAKAQRGIPYRWLLILLR